MNTKVIAIGDQHFQINNIPEVQIFIDKITKLVIEKNPDFVVLLGDLLHTHERLHTIPLNKAYEFIDNIRKHCKTYILVGNHDMCLGKNVPVMLYDGNIKMSQDIKVGDKLINENGTSCEVNNIFTGKSNMYLIKQLNAEDYIVNENHILSLKCGFHKSIFWNNTKNCWIVKWIDTNSMTLKSKFFSTYLKTKAEAKILADKFIKLIPDIDILDISVKDYLKVPKNIKDRLYGFRCPKVYWEYDEILIDPYILGMWLGDGSRNTSGFTSANLELINKWEEWTSTIDCEIVHSGGYNYSIRNRNKNNKNLKIEIGNINSSIYTCKACLHYKKFYNKAPSLACLNSKELKLLLDDDLEIKKYLSENASNEQLYDIRNKDLIKKQILLREKTENTVYIKKNTNTSKNSFINLLKFYNIYDQKFIPKKYIINDENTRLKLLAGFIDANGTISNDSRSFRISQSGINYNMINDLAFLSRSLGFSSYINSDNGHKKTLFISGDIERIPTVLNTKKAIKIINNGIDSKGRKCADKLRTSIKIKSIGIDNFYGFSVNKTNRFLLGDFTVTHNCNNQQFLSDNHWLNALKEWENLVVVDKVIIEQIKNQYFVFCPYVAPGRFEEALNTIGEKWKDATCIFAHQEFYGCKMGAITSIDGDKWPLDYPNIISGHIHKNQTPQENIYYPGSSLQIAFGETDNNVIPYIIFNNDGSYKLEEIDLILRKKKILYKTVNDIDDYKIPSTDDEIKISLSGDYNEFKTFKKTKKYKELINKGIKVIFKPKRIETEIKNENIKKIINKNTDDLTNFKKIINDIIEEHNDPYLNEIFEKVINNKD